jgi:hypothetical protein
MVERVMLRAYPFRRTEKGLRLRVTRPWQLVLDQTIKAPDCVARGLQIFAESDQKPGLYGSQAIDHFE